MQHIKFLQKTVEINPKIKIVVMCFLKLNIDMHNDTDRQFFNLLDFIIILLKHKQFQYKPEFIATWRQIQLKFRHGDKYS